MSSILDALNKLEQEKAQSRRELEEAADPVTAAHDLVGRSVLRDRVTVRVSPAALIVSAAAVLIIGVVIAIVVALSLSRATDSVAMNTDPPAGATPIESAAPAAASTGAPDTLASPRRATEDPSTFVRLPDPEPTPMPQQVQAAPPPIAGAPPRDTAPQANTVPDPPVESSPAVVSPPAPGAQPAPSAQIQPDPSPSPAPPAPSVDAPKPESAPAAGVGEEPAKPTRVARSADEITPRSARTLPAAEASNPRASRSDDLSTLPALTDADISRAGLVQLKINMPSPAGPANPQGSAILTVREEAGDGTIVTNTMKFYEGQRIQTTTLRLFKVERNAIGIEDMRTGHQYRLPF